ncbi:hypothetical protein FB45DRAFT_1021853 [Roridomyces roridus]|uniref:Uncharacterized protein n=1 Tax=Roridomyces roridus TaxID=1738132 RepID=A0AAD7C771_9AGAR|nr:hypothetical protein FB45DRAFT_1021853 [Roridomyces roridus]
MPCGGTRQRKREREGGPSVVKPGPVSWVKGSKLRFFEERKDAFIAASAAKKSTVFYNGFIREFTAVAADVVADEDVDSLDPEVATGRAKFEGQLRMKVTAWYNGHYGESRKKTASDDVPTFKKLFDKPELGPTAPTKQRVLDYYSNKFYHTRIKDRVIARWAAVSKLENPPHILIVRKAVTKVVWLSETPEFKAEVTAAMEKEHQLALQAHALAASLDTPQTAQEYQTAIHNAGYYLQPFVDAVRGYFGQNVSLFLAHAGTTNEIVPRVWSQVDPIGFAALQNSMIAFTEKCFTEAECRARVLNTTPPTVNSPTPADSRNSIPTTTAPIPTILPPAAAHTQGQQEPHQSALDGLLSLDDLNEDIFPPHNDDGVPLIDTTLFDNTLAFMTDEEAQALEELAHLTPEELDALIGKMGEAGEVRWKAGSARIRKALAGEIDALPETERMLYKNRLEQMSAAELEEENNLAEEWRVLRRINSGMAIAAAMAESDAEEDVDMTAPLPANDPPAPPLTSDDPPAPPPASNDPTAPPPANNDPPAPPPANNDPPAPPPASNNLPAPPPASNDPPALPPVQNELPPLPPANQESPPLPPASNDKTPSPPSDDSPPPPPVDDDPPPPPPPSNPPTPPPTGSELPQRERSHTPASGDESPEPPHPSDNTLGTPPPPPVTTRPVPRPKYKWSEPTAAWSAEVKCAYGAFQRGKEWGSEWKRLVDAVVKLERLWSFPDRGLTAAPPGKERPEEVEAWMRDQRKWGERVVLQSGVGPRDQVGSFSARWWAWLGAAQPAGRVTGGGWKGVEEMSANTWDELAKMHGRNGMLLYAAGLLWWGEAVQLSDDAEALRADWLLAVHDLTAILEATMKRIPSVKKAVKASERNSAVMTRSQAAQSVPQTRAGTKRKAGDTDSGKAK